MRFTERAIYVTGGGHGIGRAVAKRLAGEGGSVAVSDRDDAAANAVAREIDESGGIAFATSCDITDALSVAASFAAAMQRFGRLDVLVNAAGGDWIEPPSFEDIDDELWHGKLDLNLTGVVRCIRAALPGLIAAGSRSSVVSIGSINGTIALSGYPYSAAKAGLEILTKSLAAKYGDKGVRFNLPRHRAHARLGWPRRSPRRSRRDVPARPGRRTGRHRRCRRVPRLR